MLSKVSGSTLVLHLARTALVCRATPHVPYLGGARARLRYHFQVINPEGQKLPVNTFLIKAFSSTKEKFPMNAYGQVQTDESQSGWMDWYSAVVLVCVYFVPRSHAR